MTELKAYPKYKDSGIGWMGEIPEEWKKTKVSWLFSNIGSGGTPSSRNNKYYDNGNINWINTGDLNDGYLKNTKNKITEDALKDLTTLKIYPENSLVIAMYGATIGKLAVTKIQATTNQACCVMSKPVNTSIKFMYYWFLTSREDIINSSSGGGQPNISQSLIKNLNVFLPDILEQDRIVSFLDNKTSEIASLISNKELLIKLLEEKRQAIITETVTKGLNPNVKMKDSGIEWIGEIPEHWEVGKVGYAFEITLGKMIQTVKKQQSDTLIPYLKANNVQNGYINFNTIDKMYASITDITRYKLKKGDLLVCEGGEVGRSSIIKDEINLMIFQNALHRVRGTSKGNVVYLHYLLNVVRQTGYINILVNKATIAHFTRDKFNSLNIPLPPYAEQVEMVSYIDEKSSKINKTIDLINEQINKLKEYRESIIYEAVTGKVDLR